jgi:hypothetical protein
MRIRLSNDDGIQTPGIGVFPGVKTLRQVDPGAGAARKRAGDGLYQAEVNPAW